MPIQLKVWYKDRSDTIITVWNNQQIQSFSLDLKKPISYIFFDPDNWILKEADWEIWTDVTDELTNEIPLQYNLQQNYPNPFNANAVIPYQLPQAGFLRIDIYNLLGQKIKTLVDKMHLAGHFRITWDGKDSDGRYVTSGIYFYKIEAENFVDVKKMLFLE